MNNDTINRIAEIALADLLDYDPTPTALNDDDFADIAETILIHDKIDYDPSTDLQLISDAMIKLCNARNIAH
jgi:hypothetical protein